MFIDTILFLAGGVLAFITLFIMIYLVVSYKRSKVYRDVLQQETELNNTLIDSFTRKDTDETLSGNNDSELQYVKTILSDNTYGDSQILRNDSTELSYDNAGDSTEQSYDNAGGDFDLDVSVLEGRYILRREIRGGGMSRVFLADSAKLGNQWIIKYISNQYVELLNEENILKLLNHISLPKIIDIFKDGKGVFLVESFIEGVTLDNVLKSGYALNQAIVEDWAEQLAQVLNYLHMLKPRPIYHYDLKPSNIMVTHDNRLVLIDFGVSKRLDENSASAAAVGVTYKYAAPEQLKRRIAEKYAPLINDRFGGLPEARIGWNPDARTDIYSLGVILFELATGQIPTVKNQNALKNTVSREMYEIIIKCLSADPAGRYQTAAELLLDIQKAKSTKIKMARTLFFRKIASVSCAFSVIASGGSFTGGYYIWGQENAATLEIRPETAVVSLQQSCELAIEKHMPDGASSILDNSQIRWSYSRDNIARVDGNRLSGINVGKAELSGRYRNKTISLDVRVVEPMDAIVDISQLYESGHTIKVYAGTAERAHNDGALQEAEFVSPESIAISGDGTIYIADSGLLRRIRGETADSINFEPAYLTPKIVRCYNDDVYVLTNEWEEGEGVYYGVIKLAGGAAEGLYMADAAYTAIEDFTFSPGGLIYFIERNSGIGGAFLKTLNPSDADDIQTLCELPEGTCSLAINERGDAYLANPDFGVILIWQNDTLSYLSGVENEKAFIDGNAPLYYMPQKIKYSGDFLYIWDFNVLRRIDIAGGAAAECITIAGEASPAFDLDIAQPELAAEDIVLPNSKLMDFIVGSDSILITDPKRGVIWRVD